MIRYINILLVLILFFSSCEEKESLVETGYLFVNASMDYSLVTKADEKDQQISVAICKAAGDTVQFFENYKTDLGTKKVQLATGTYHIKAGTVHAGKATFDKPFYFGIDTIQVEKGKLKEAEVVCTQANVKVTINYSDLLKKFFTGYKATISNVSGELTFEEEEKRAGYFAPGKLNVTLNLVNNDGTAYKIVKEIPDTKAREHYRLTFSVGEEPDSPEAGGDFDITVDESTNDIDCTLKVPVFTDDYGRNMPKIAWTPGDKLSIKETNPENKFQLTSQITSKKGFQVVALKLNSQYFNVQEGLPAYIDLMHADEAMYGKLSGMGISYPKLSETMSDVTIDFSALLKMLPLSVDGKKTSHSIAIVVRDNLGQQVEDTVMVEVRPNVSVETTVNSWARFAFISVIAGSDQNISVKYKKKDGAENWNTITVLADDVKQTDDGYSFKTLLNDLSPETVYIYEIQADKDLSAGSFTTEKEAVLTGGGFDDWNKNNPSNSFWSSGNNTFVGNLLSPTDQLATQGEKNKYAANLQSRSVPIVNFGAGNLFTGDFSVVGTSGGKISLGRSFPSKPTKLKGYYHYTPGKIDVAGTITLPSNISVNVKQDASDTCSVYIALSKEPFTVNTTEPKSLFDMKMPAFKERIIAYAELPSLESLTTGGKYKEFELVLKYFHSDYTGPVYLVIVCSASKYGDYFKGSTGSNLKLDEFELLYEYDEKCFK